MDAHRGIVGGQGDAGSRCGRGEVRQGRLSAGAADRSSRDSAVDSRPAPLASARRRRGDAPPARAWASGGGQRRQQRADGGKEREEARPLGARKEERGDKGEVQPAFGPSWPV